MPPMRSFGAREDEAKQKERQMTRSQTTAAALAVLCLGGLVRAGAQDDYKARFGREEAALADDAGDRQLSAFAYKLLQAARAADKEKDLQALLCEKVVEYGARNPVSYWNTLEAIRLLVQLRPAQKDQIYDRAVETCQQAFTRSTGERRRAVGERLIAALMDSADQRVGRDPMRAIELYRRAQVVVGAVRSDRERELGERIREAACALPAARRLAALRAALASDPRGAKARVDLIEAYLGEFNDPAEAAALLNDDLDERLRTYVPLAAGPVWELKEAACLELAHWYAELASRAHPSGQVVLLRRSAACCRRYLVLHETRDAARLKVNLLLEEVDKKTARIPGLPKDLVLDLGRGVEMKLVLIPPGTFTMGSSNNEKDREDNEGPRREVTISRAFYMGVHEVTQEQYATLTGDMSNYFNRRPQNPAEQMSDKGVVAFLEAMSRRTGRLVRLPTEAEWEYACRAGTRTRFAFGEDEKDLDACAWHSGNSGGTTHPVGQKKPNAWGLYDMHGNVYEACGDRHESSYAGAASCDPRGPNWGDKRIRRGGAYSSQARYCRSANRADYAPRLASRNRGLRVVVIPSPPE